MTGRLRANDKVHYVGQTKFTIDRNFSDLKLVGKGSYGVVCSALDTIHNRKVAIKKITPITRDIQDAKHVLREIRLMRHMGKHENVITLYDLYIRDSADELYIVMELLDSDLHRVLQSPQKLTNGHFRHFFFQLLCGVKYLHDNRIIHRDLKPGNLLVSRDCNLRITDFGLARERPVGNRSGNTPYDDDDIDEPMTEHVVTRWYRPPELMLCPDGLYNYAIDMWSCGCIFAEMLARRPLFPGKNFIEQLTLIFNIIGSPLPKDVKHIENIQAKKFLDTQKGKQRANFQKLFPDYPPEAIQILETLLIFKPSDRLTCDETLLLPYFDKMPSSASMVFPKTSSLFEFDFERTQKPSKSNLKQLIMNEVTSIKKDNKRKTSRETSGSEAKRVADDDTVDDDKSKASNHSGGSTTINNQVHAKGRKTTNTRQHSSTNPRAGSTGRVGMSRQPVATKKAPEDSGQNTARAISTGRAGPNRPSRKAAIVPQAQPPYKQSASQRPVPSTATAMPGRVPSVNPPVIPVADEKPRGSSGYASKRSHVGNIYNNDFEGNDEPAAESKEFDTTENFGKAPKPPVEDFSAAREFLRTPQDMARLNAKHRPASGGGTATGLSNVSKVKPPVDTDYGYESPDEAKNSSDKRLDKNDIILNSPSRLNKNACNILSDEKFSNKAMELLHRTSTAPTGRGTVTDSGDVGDRTKKAVLTTILKDVSDDDTGILDDNEEDEDSDDEDIVAKMYRLYGKKESSVPDRNRPTSAAVTRGDAGNKPPSALMSNLNLHQKADVLLESDNDDEEDDDDEIEPPAGNKLYTRPSSGGSSRLRSGHHSNGNDPVVSNPQSSGANQQRDEVRNIYDEVKARVDSVAASKDIGTDLHRHDDKAHHHSSSGRYIQHKEDDRGQTAVDRDIRGVRDGERDRNTTTTKPSVAPKKKSGLTVPQSPQFSKMSWQRSRDAKRERNGNTQNIPAAERPTIPDRYSRKGPPMGGTRGGGDNEEHMRKARASSAPRGRPVTHNTDRSDDDSTSRREGGALNAKGGNNANNRSRRLSGSGYAAPTAATMGRSASSGRMGMRR